MAKRFTDTGKWEDPWFRSLPGVAKLVFLYVIDRCNNAGFWEKDMDAMAWHTKLKMDHIEAAMKPLSRGLVEVDGWIWVRRFLRHQKNEELSSNNPAHKQIVTMIREQMNRFSSVPEFQEFIAPYKGLLSPSQEAAKPYRTGIGKVKEEEEEGMQGEKPKRTKREPVVVNFPETLDTPEFRDQWQLWEEHRKEIKKPLTQKSVDEQLKQCAEMGLERAIAAIKHTIRGGWQGLFEDRSRLNGTNGAPVKPSNPTAGFRIV